MIARTTMPDKMCRSYTAWTQYIANENAVIRAVDQIRRHLNFCSMAATARDIQRNSRK